MNDESQPVESRFEVRAIYGTNTRRGLVEGGLGGGARTLPPSKVREMAQLLLEGAASAEGDEALLRVASEVGISDQRALHLLRAMRQERALIFERARREALRAIAYDQGPPDD